jgi:rod shape determining protein RodA
VICVGVAAMTFWHVCVNIAMVLGLAPVVGVTLPFISYGGSSLVAMAISMGFVLALTRAKPRSHIAIQPRRITPMLVPAE